MFNILKTKSARKLLVLGIFIFIYMAFLTGCVTSFDFLSMLIIGSMSFIITLGLMIIIPKIVAWVENGE